MQHLTPKILCVALVAVLTNGTPVARIAHAEDTSEELAPRAPEEGGPRRWAVAAPDGLRYRKAASGDAAVIAVLPNGAVLSNMGCAPGADRIWCDVRPFRGGARGFADAALLTPATGPDGIVPRGPNESRLRARKRSFDAQAEVRCAQEQGQALTWCKAGVARADGGDASIAVTFPNGFIRTLYFIHGEFVSASATMSGVGRDTDWHLEGDIHRIRVDDQRYELPHPFVFGD